MTRPRYTWQRLEVAGRKFLPARVSPRYLPDLLPVLLANWQQGISIPTDWTTDVTESHLGNEERRGLIGRPHRRLVCEIGAVSAERLFLLQNSLLRAANQPLLIPLYPQRAHLTSAVASGATSLPGDFDYRRFPEGCRAVIASFARDGWPTNVEFVEVATSTGPTSTTLELAAATTLDHPARARVMPLVEVEALLETLQAEVLSDETGAVTLTFEEVLGPSAFPPWIPNFEPPDLPTWRQAPILTIRPDWAQGVQFLATRQGTRQQLGRSSFSVIEGEGPRMGHGFGLHAIDRAAIWRQMQFVDSCMGRLNPFWELDLKRPWVLREIAVGSVTIEPQEHVSVEDFRRFYRGVALHYMDGTFEVREVDTVDVVAGPGYRLNFPADAALRASQATSTGLVAACGPAYLSRLRSDDYVERWADDASCAVDLQTIELRREGPARIRTFDEVVVQLPPLESLDATLYLDAGTNMFQPDQSPCTMDGDPVRTWLDARPGFNGSAESPGDLLDGELFAGQPQLYVPAPLPGSPPETSGLELQIPATLHDNARGMTIFVVAQRPAADQANLADHYLVRYPNASDDGSDSIDWTWDRVVMNDDAGRDDEDSWIETPTLGLPRQTKHVLCLVWAPGQFARVYQGGRLQGQAARPVWDLPEPTGLPRIFRGTRDPADVPPVATNLGFYSFLSFDRALSVEELNGYGQQLGTWTRIV